MLTGKRAEGRAAAATGDSSGALPAERALVCWYDGEFVPLAEAKIGVMTHAFLYGTAIFEGIRAYWNEDQDQLFGLFLLEHYRRMAASARVMFMDLPGPPEAMVELTADLLRRNGFREDTYVRPSLFKSTEAIGVRLHNLEHRLIVFCLPFGDYIDTTRGISAMTVSWRRNSDISIPARSKIVGAYVNSAFAKTEAQLNGYDEAIVLTLDGHASEGSAENLFMVRNGKLVTPPVSDDILEGITRTALIELARTELGIDVVERPIDRSELYVAEEVLLCGTGAQVSPVVSIDHRAIGEGRIGPIGARLRDLYFDAVRGRLPAYAHWLTPIY
ncbi:MAG TPA: branched-chain amino acid transaminase [Candidatus Limnocylindrales bacterium]|jgi:branched-chain amino acid aminotransferase|nr:branched-chain amino acid transaminase [Candidatus Limnocylindrales bacterium]